jgi:predicted MFS family arabinose efflux permease
VLNDPAWQAITPEIVSQENFAAGVALNSAGFNVARAIGPAVGGLVIAAFNSGIAFLLNAASFFGVIYFLYCWKRKPHNGRFRLQGMNAATLQGLRHLRRSPAMQGVLVRSAAFGVPGSALLAMLPLLAHPFGSQGYGLLLGVFGLGALAGAAVMPVLRRSLSVDQLVASSTVVFALATAAGGHWQTFIMLALATFCGGMAWIQILASLNVSAQIMSPTRMRARAISMYLLVLQGGLAGGAALWGAVSEWAGMQRALLCAGVALVAGIPLAVRFRLPAVEAYQPEVLQGSDQAS